MSALEINVRVSAEKQTLILAGELVPQRSETGLPAGGRTYASPVRNAVTVAAAPIDDRMLIIQHGFDEITPVDRGRSFNAANAYALTQGLSNAQPAIIDIYA